MLLERALKLSVELATKVVSDASLELRELGERPYNRQRSMYIRFIRQPDNESFIVEAWGKAFPEDGGGGYRGRLTASTAEISAAVGALRATWHSKILSFVGEREGGGRWYPFVDSWDLSPGPYAGALDDLGLDLARAGATLFSFLFERGDSGLSEIASRLTAALNRGEQVISVESDSVLVPWSMLYTGTKELWGDAPSWTLEGFWGFRHLVEHALPRCGPFESRIQMGGRPAIGLNIDEKVDSEYPPTRCMSSIVDFFTENCDVVVRRRKDTLAQALRDPQLPDLVSLFGCHGHVGGLSGVSEQQAYLELEDGEKIYSSEFAGWLANKSLVRRPVIFMSACQGGQLSSMFYPSFGRYLLDSGARSLVGPEIDLPRVFAEHYVTALFSRFLQPSTRLGDAMRDLARELAISHGNPLGLAFNLYRGLDVHFCCVSVAS